MGYQDNFPHANAVIMAAFGKKEEVTYTRKDTGSSGSFRAMVDFQYRADDQGYKYRVAILQVDASNVPNPVEGDTVTIDGEAWTVRIEDELEGDGTYWRFMATRAEGRKF